MAFLAEQVGERLKSLRDQKGYSRDALAKKIGRNLQQIRRYEIGEVFPPEDALIALAEALDTTVEDIFSGGGMPAHLAANLPKSKEGLRIGARIRKLRDGRPIKRLALLAGLPEDHWAWYEEGVCAPSSEFLPRIADALGCDVKDILGYDPRARPAMRSGVFHEIARADDFTQRLLTSCRAQLAEANQQIDDLLKERAQLLERIADLDGGGPKPDD